MNLNSVILEIILEQRVVKNVDTVRQVVTVTISICRSNIAGEETLGIPLTLDLILIVLEYCPQVLISTRIPLVLEHVD